MFRLFLGNLKLLLHERLQNPNYHFRQFPNLLSTASKVKYYNILEYIILYDFRSPLKFSDFSRHLDVGLWSGESLENRRLFMEKRKSEEV
jgi:hypothetical protein